MLGRIFPVLIHNVVDPEFDHLLDVGAWGEEEGREELRIQVITDDFCPSYL